MSRNQPPAEPHPCRPGKFAPTTHAEPALALTRTDFDTAFESAHGEALTSFRPFLRFRCGLRSPVSSTRTCCVNPTPAT